MLLRVGQFNVFNLVREGVNVYNGVIYTKDEVDRKVRWIADQLIKMKSDIVGFQEVFHDDILKRAIDLSGLYTNSQVICYGANGSGPKVALVSKFPVLEQEQIEDFPADAKLELDHQLVPISKFARPVLRCVVSLPTGDLVTVFVLHLKSQRPMVEMSKRHDQKQKALGHAKSLVVRAAESAAMRCILVDEMINNKRPVVVCGDLNDVVHSVTTEIVTGTPPWKNLKMEQKEQIWDVLLWSTNEVQVRQSDRDVTYSHIHNGRYLVLDHILVSQEFVRTNPERIGYIQFLHLFNDHLIDETLSDERADITMSDHGQVVAVIKIYDSVHKKEEDTADDSAGFNILARSPSAGGLVKSPSSPSTVGTSKRARAGSFSAGNSGASQGTPGRTGASILGAASNASGAAPPALTISAALPAAASADNTNAPSTMAPVHLDGHLAPSISFGSFDNLHALPVDATRSLPMQMQLSSPLLMPPSAATLPAPAAGSSAAQAMDVSGPESEANSQSSSPLEFPAVSSPFAAQQQQQQQRQQQQQGRRRQQQQQQQQQLQWTGQAQQQQQRPPSHRHPGNGNNGGGSSSSSNDGFQFAGRSRPHRAPAYGYGRQQEQEYGELQPYDDGFYSTRVSGYPHPRFRSGGGGSGSGDRRRR